MDIFLKETNYQKLTQKKNSLVIFILSIKKQNCSQNFSTKKTPDPDRFANLCYQTLKREIITVLQISPENWRGGNISWLHTASTTLLQKPKKDVTWKCNYRLIHLTNIDAKILDEILVN